MIAIRKLDPDEWPLFKAIRLEALATDPQAFGAVLSSGLDRPDEFWRNRLQDALSDPLRSLLFATEEGRIVGLVGAMPTDEPGTAHIISMYVTPAARGRGLARQLVAALMGELQESGKVEALTLEVNPSQVPALSLYRSFGFEVYDEQELTRSDGSTIRELRMRRVGCGSFSATHT